MKKYLAADREGKIQYAKEHVSPQIIVNYQNKIGKAMLQGKPVPGFAGERKRRTELKIHTVKKNEHILSIIREDGVHISSFSVDDEDLRKIIKDNFWVLKKRNI